MQVYDRVLSRMKKSFEQVLKRTGDPFDESTLYGPLHSEQAVLNFTEALEQAKQLGGQIEFGGKVLSVKFSFRSFC